MRDTEPEIPRRALPQAEETRRRRALHQELAVRAGVALLMLAFNELFTMVPAAKGMIRLAALLGFLVNLPYYVAARSGRLRRLQAWIRMVMDVAFITAGLYGAGGLAAAPYLGIYAIVPVYGGIVFSSRACLVITQLATSAYLAMAAAQRFGLLPFTSPPHPDAWEVAIFNLLVLNIVGGLAAVLADAFRRNRYRLAAAYGELERAHDQSLRMHAQIERAGRLYAVNEVVAGVTHEMRNVIMATISHGHLLRRRLASADPETLRHVDQVQHGLDNAARIMKNVLDTARQPSSERGPISIPDVVHRVVELKGFDVRQDGIAMRVEFPSPFPTVVASAFQLEQVLLNLVGNAHEALRGGRQGGAITIAGAVDAGRAVVEVLDNGPGIAAEALPRIFEPFYTTKASGTGLGLAISAGIVREFGGELTATNRPGGGAVFRLAFPAAA